MCLRLFTMMGAFWIMEALGYMFNDLHPDSTEFLETLKKVFDFCNALHGLFIFALFVIPDCMKKTKLVCLSINMDTNISRLWTILLYFYWSMIGVVCAVSKMVAKIPQIVWIWALFGPHWIVQIRRRRFVLWFIQMNINLPITCVCWQH